MNFSRFGDGLARHGHMFGPLVRWLSVIAAFLFIFRKSPSVKPFDALIIILGGLVLMELGIERRLEKAARLLRPVFVALAALVACIAAAQLFRYMDGSNTVILGETLKNHGRVVFNIFTLVIVSLLVAREKKALPLLSAAVVFAPIVVLPAYGNMDEGVFISGGRLAGSMLQPIIFGAWMLAVYFVGLGMIASLTSAWQRTFLALWLAVIANFILWAASRAAWVAFFPALILFLGYYFMRGERGKAVFLFLTVLITFSFGYVFLPTRALHVKTFVYDRAVNLAQSVIALDPARVYSQEQTATMPASARFALRNPVGLGFGGSITPISHNSYIELALLGGWGALLALGAFFFGVAKRAWAFMRAPRGSEVDGYIIAWIAASAAFMADIFFTQGILWRQTWFVFGVLTGVTYLLSFELRVLPIFSKGEISPAPTENSILQT